MSVEIIVPSVIDLIGPVPYWLLVVMLVGACAMWTVNAISVCYSEIGRQIAELKREKD